MVLNFRSRRFLFHIIAAAIIVCLCWTTLLLIYKVEDIKDGSKIKNTLSNNPVERKKHLIEILQKEVNDQIQKLRDSTLPLSRISINTSLSSYSPKSSNRSIQQDSHNYIKQINSSGILNYSVHTFYYPWYGNPEFDGKYLHWNHPFLPHWDKKEAKRWPKGQHEPPDDIGASFYPELGPYSSKDPKVVRKHLQDIKYAGIGVMVVSWYPPGDADFHGEEPDRVMPLIMDTAAEHGIKVAFHIEPYKGRDHLTLKKNLQYIMKTYGNHKAFYRRYHKEKKKNLPLYYIYDSYQVSSRLWANLFKQDGQITVRGTDLDGIFIGLLVEDQHKVNIYSAGFDGFYTYFATNGFTYGSSWDKWKDLQKYAVSHSKIFIPCIGPGYIDTNVRPWNAKNTRNRNAGHYYRRAFDAALKVNPSIISITSFNEWHEGTQIEPAVSKSTEEFLYLDYGHNQSSRLYLDLTREFADKYSHT